MNTVVVSAKVIGMMKREIGELEKMIAKKQARLNALKSSLEQMIPLQSGKPRGRKARASEGDRVAAE